MDDHLIDDSADNLVKVAGQPAIDFCLQSAPSSAHSTDSPSMATITVYLQSRYDDILSNHRTKLMHRWGEILASTYDLHPYRFSFEALGGEPYNATVYMKVMSLSDSPSTPVTYEISPLAATTIIKITDIDMALKDADTIDWFIYVHGQGGDVASLTVDGTRLFTYGSRSAACAFDL